MFNMKRQRFGTLSGIFVVALVLLTAVFYTGDVAAAAGEVNLMTWGGDFIPRAIISEFEQETGIKVNLSLIHI